MTVLPIFVVKTGWFGRMTTTGARLLPHPGFDYLDFLGTLRLYKINGSDFSLLCQGRFTVVYMCLFCFIRFQSRTKKMTGGGGFYGRPHTVPELLQIVADTVQI